MTIGTYKIVECPKCYEKMVSKAVQILKCQHCGKQTLFYKCRVFLEDPDWRIVRKRFAAMKQVVI